MISGELIKWFQMLGLSQTGVLWDRCGLTTQYDSAVCFFFFFFQYTFGLSGVFSQACT